MKKGVKIGIGIVLLVVSVGVAAKIVQINQKYPQVQKEKISFGETAEMKDGIYLKVLDAKLQSEEEARKAYGEDFAKEMEEGYEYRVCKVDVELENRTDKEQAVSLYDIYLETNTYCNGLAPEVFCNTDENQEMELTLSPNEKKEQTLGYVIYKMQFSKKQWNGMEEENFFLVNERYPVKKRWKCK